MNLIKSFHKTIAEMGIPFLEHPIFYKAPVGIRFEIDGKDDVYIKKGLLRKLYPNPVYVNEAVERALAIFRASPQKNWLLRIDLL